MLDAHTLHMDICEIQFFYKNISLHTFFPMPLGYVHGAYISQKKCGTENSWVS
jgi:hypothetical protein